MVNKHIMLAVLFFMSESEVDEWAEAYSVEGSQT